MREAASHQQSCTASAAASARSGRAPRGHARTLRLRFGLVLALLAALPLPAAGQSATDAAALRVLDDLLAAYNASDEQAWLACFFFPNARIAAGRLDVFPDPESYRTELSLNQHGWDYAKWTQRRVVKSEIGKVHVLARFTRYRANGVSVDSYDSLYVIVLRGGRWGIVARSD